MNIEQLTIGQAREIAAMFPSTAGNATGVASGSVSPFCPGMKFLFRGVTHYSLGVVFEQFGSIIRLEEASWIADTGRFGECIANGTLKEVELVGTMYVNLEACMDIIPWKHDLPTESK